MRGYKNQDRTGYVPLVDLATIEALRSGGYSLHNATFAPGRGVVVGRTDQPVPLRGSLAVGDQRDKMQTMDLQRSHKK